MSINNNPYDFLNTSALDAMRKLQETSALTAALKMEPTSAFAAIRELQSTLNAEKSSMGGATAALEEYRKVVAPILESVKEINTAYAPIFEQTKVFDSLNIKGIIAGLQTSSAAMSSISGLNLSEIASIVDALPKYDFLSDMVSDDFTISDAEELYESGEITQDDINEEISEIVNKKQFSPKAEWDKLKKSKWLLAIKILIVLVTFVCKPVTEYITDKALDELGINEFWENSGVYDLIDSIFREGEDSTVSETEAKKSVDKAKTGNVSKQRRDDLLVKIKDIRTFISAAPQDENTGNLLSYLSELEKDVCGKKYGLVFEEHREEINEVLDTHTPVLTEEKDLFIDNGGQMNFLIEGDNLASLKLLEKTHKEKIKMIYIDPPYNTANKDFAYDDTRVDATDTFRHSKWLSFMRVRLKIARNLLSNDGILFISIDDNEQADLKLLCDEIFKEENFFSQVIVQSNKRGQTYKQIAKTHEYLLIYTRSPEAEFNEIDKTDEDNDLNLLDGISAYNVRELRNRNPKFGKHNRPNLFYPIYVNPLTIDKDGFCPVSLTQSDEYYIEVFPYNSTGVESCWRWGTKLFSENVNADTQMSNVVARAKRDGVFNIYEKYRKTTYKAKSIWVETDVITEKGTVELGELGLAERFPFPKPLFLLKKCLQIGTNPNDIILDFFAGSGTTGHAVMKLNAEDGGNRRFILCTNNENNICHDVTYERIKRVIDKENYSASLKYYKVDYIPISDRMYYEYADELLLHIRELVELENGVNFTDNAEIGIVLTEEELDEFIANTDSFVKCRKLYMGHDVLPTEEQEKKLQAHDIEISIIPDYYYRDLQEG